MKPQVVNSTKNAKEYALITSENTDRFEVHKMETTGCYSAPDTMGIE